MKEKEKDNVIYDEKNKNGYIKYINEDLSYDTYIELYTVNNVIQNLKTKINNNNFYALDLGCGDGRYTRILRNFTNGIIYGMDISPFMIDVANNVEKKNTKNIKYFIADCFKNQRILFNENKFDLITAFWLLSYCSNENILENTLLNISSYLNPGGYFVFILQNPSNTPSTYKETIKFGYATIPSNKNFNREKYNDGENLLCIFCEKNNLDNQSFIVDSYHYEMNTILNKIKIAGMKLIEIKDMMIDPNSSFIPDSEVLIKTAGMLIVTQKIDVHINLS